MFLVQVRNFLFRIIVEKIQVEHNARLTYQLFRLRWFKYKNSYITTYVNTTSTNKDYLPTELRKIITVY